jgi:hypothetical protein
LIESDQQRLFQYPVRALAADYLRSIVGIAATAGLLVFAQPALFPALILTGGAALFLVYFARTVCRQLTRIALDEAGISASGPLGASIRWDALRALQLEYYSTRSDREEGWMQLKLRDERSTIRIDSGIGDFARLAGVAAQQAERRNVVLDAASRANFAALGIRPESA